MAETLSKLLLDEQEETNEYLNMLDDRFLEFFRQSARDKMDLMELLREQKEGTDGAANDGRPSTNDTPEDPTKSFLAGLGTLGIGVAAAIAVGLNSLGAAFIPSSETMTKITKSISSVFKGIGGLMEEGLTKVKQGVSLKTAELVEKFSELGKSIKGLAASLKASVVGKITKGIETAKGIGSSISNFVGGKVSNFVGGAVNKAKSVGGTVVNAAKTVGGNIAGLARAGADDVAIRGMVAMDSIKAKGSKFAQGAAELGAKIAPKVGSTIRLAGKILKPLAVLTSAYDGYKMATEEGSENLGTAGKIMVGTAGGLSALVGGTADFIKMITVDAPIALAQSAGLVSESGALANLRNTSIQAEIDSGIRTARDVMSGSIQQYQGEVTSAGNTNVTYVQSTNAPQTNNNVTQAYAAPTPAVYSNGTRSDAYSN